MPARRPASSWPGSARTSSARTRPVRTGPDRAAGWAGPCLSGWPCCWCPSRRAAWPRPGRQPNRPGPARSAVRPGPGAAARQALAGLTAGLRELGEQGLRGDGLAWIHGVTAAVQPDLAGLPALGAATGIAVLLSTADEAAATALAEEVRVVVAAGPVSQGLETMLRGRALVTDG